MGGANGGANTQQHLINIIHKKKKKKKKTKNEKREQKKIKRGNMFGLLSKLWSRFDVSHTRNLKHYVVFGEREWLLHSSSPHLFL